MAAGGCKPMADAPPTGTDVRAVVAPAGRRWLSAVGAALLALTLVPLAVGAAATPTGHVFSGFVLEARDHVSYVADAMEGLEGRWLYHDPYTSDPHPRSLIYLPYLVLGQLDRGPRRPLPVLPHLPRLGL